MPRRIQVEKKQLLSCDFCKKEEVLSLNAKRTGWLSVMCTANDGLRLFEKKDEIPRYESFNIPNKEEKVYCSRECVFTSLTQMIDLFISEIVPHSIVGLKRKKIEISQQ